MSANPTESAIAEMEPIVAGLGFLPSLGEAANVSIAISLRRIADAQERLVHAFEYNPTSYNIIDAIKESRS